MAAMQGAYLPGNRTVQIREVPVPEPAAGQVLVRMKASGICGSDIHAIYREHLGKGPEAYDLADKAQAGKVAICFDEVLEP
jgi:threonine dehydrogenase-like Zn-dependent dehydrogenase